MPTIFRQGPYRFFFYASDRNEPPHVHVERDNRIAKFWLAPVRMQSGGGMSGLELRRIARIIEQQRDSFMGAWDGGFDN